MPDPYPESARTADLHRVTAGDEDAFSRLLVYYHEPLLAKITSALNPTLTARLDPQDILQEALTNAFKTLRARNPLPVAAGPRTGRPPREETTGAPHDADSVPTPLPPREGAGGGSTAMQRPVPDPRGEDVAAGPRTGRPVPLDFPTPAAFYKWLETIALTRLKDAERALRRRKRDVAREARVAAGPTTSYPDLFDRLTREQSTPSRHLAKQEAIAAVMTCLARLTDEQREVIRLRILEARPVPEVAALMGKSEPAIHMLSHRALTAMREHARCITKSTP